MQFHITKWIYYWGNIIFYLYVALFKLLISIRNARVQCRSITSWGTRFFKGFVLIFKYPLIFMNMQMRLFYIGPLDEMNIYFGL